MGRANNIKFNFKISLETEKTTLTWYEYYHRLSKHSHTIQIDSTDHKTKQRYTDTIFTPWH